MKYIVYQITNTITGKIYIGAHSTTDIDDGYMSSSVVVRDAIKKYGIDNFSKTVLSYHNSEQEMYSEESTIVNESFVARSDTYNLKPGGYGGWTHINDGSQNHIDRCKEAGRRARKKLNEGLATGKYKQPGSRSQENMEKLCKLSQTRTAKAKRLNTFKRIKHSQGKNNSQYGTVWCVLKDAKDCLGRKKFKKDSIPENWISTAKWRDSRKDKKNSAYGKSWYNDGIKNFLLSKNDSKINELGLTKGRLLIRRCDEKDA